MKIWGGISPKKAEGFHNSLVGISETVRASLTDTGTETNDNYCFNKQVAHSE